MIPVSAELRKVVRQPHRRTVRVTSLPSGADIPVSGGLIKHGIEGDSNPHEVRSAALTIPGFDFVPKDENSPLAPFGQRLHIEIGIETSVGGWEWVDQGEFLVLSAQVDRPTGGVKVQCVDLAHRVDRVVADSARQINATQAAATQIQALVREAIGVTVAIARDDSNGADPDDVTDIDYRVGTSLWSICKDIASEVGCSVGFTRNGQLQLLAIDPVGGAPVETLDTGEHGVIIQMQSEVSRADFVNEYVVQMSDQANPPNTAIGRARITSGVLAWNGPMGLIRRGETRGGLLSIANDAANKYAQRKLDELSRRVREIQLRLVPMPYLEPGDWVEVVFPGGGSEKGRIQSVTHGVEPSAPTQAVVRWEPGLLVGPLRSSGFLEGER